MNFGKILPYFSAAFLGGAFFAAFSPKLVFLILIVLVASSGIIALGGRKMFFTLSVLFFAASLGSGYFWLREAHNRPEAQIEFNRSVPYLAVVKNDPEAGLEYDRMILEIKTEKEKATLVAFFRPFSGIHYGDIVSFRSSVKSIPQGFYLRLAERKCQGIVNVWEFEKQPGFSGSRVLGAIFNFKEKMVSVLRKRITGDSGNLMAGMIFGEDSWLSKEFREEMKLSGTTHLTAVSGYNFYVIFALISPLSFLLPRKKRFVFLGLFAVLFTIMTGAESSVLRAAFMAMFCAAAARFERLALSGRSLCFAALFIALINPLVLFYDLGFQLSFAAFFGIGFLSPLAARKLNWKSGWKTTFLDALSAQFCVLPVLCTRLGYFSLFPVVPNAIVVSFVPLAATLGIITLLSEYLFPGLSVFFGFLSAEATAIIRRIISLSASAPDPIKNILSYILLFSVFIFSLVFLFKKFSRTILKRV